MIHIAIMKKSWRLTAKILTGEKKIETRWYKVKASPWDKVSPGDQIYFKDSGDPISVKATVSKVEQFENLNESSRVDILKKYASSDLGTEEIPRQISEYIANKRYCIIIHLINPAVVSKPFRINKKGFGSMSSWLCVEDINQVIV